MGEIDLIIENCKENYTTRDIENVGINSCYIPQCTPPCVNGGKCIDNNVCDCSGLPYTGSYCGDYYPLKRIELMDTIYRIISAILLLTALVLSIGIIIFKRDQEIKAGSIEFLNVILIGIIINSIYILTLSFERTKNKCILLYLSKNLGFSLIFGTILVKSLRIYIIFKYVKHSTGLKRGKMYLIIFSVAIVHILMMTFWILTDNVNTTKDLTNGKKEYNNCSYHDSKAISTVINIAVLFIGYFLSYANRNVKKDFKEEMTIPVYTYILFTLLMEIINAQTGISHNVQDLFSVIGTTINTFITIHFLYTVKFYNLHERKYIESKNSLAKASGSLGNINGNNAMKKYKSAQLGNIRSNESIANTKNKCKSTGSLGNDRKLNKGGSIYRRRDDVYDSIGSLEYSKRV